MRVRNKLLLKMGKTHSNDYAHAWQSRGLFASLKDAKRSKQRLMHTEERTSLCVIGESAIYHHRTNARDTELQLAQDILMLECAMRELDTQRNAVATHIIHTVTPKVYEQVRHLTSFLQKCAGVQNVLPADTLLHEIAIHFADTVVIPELAINKLVNQLRYSISSYMPQAIYCGIHYSVACIDVQKFRKGVKYQHTYIDLPDRDISRNILIYTNMPAYEVYLDSQQNAWREFEHYVNVKLSIARLTGVNDTSLSFALSDTSMVFDMLFDTDYYSKIIERLFSSHSTQDLYKTYALAHAQVQAVSDQEFTSSSKLKSLAIVNSDIEEEHLKCMHGYKTDSQNHSKLLEVMKLLTKCTTSGNTVYTHIPSVLQQQCIILSKVQLYKHHSHETYGVLSDLSIGALVIKQSVEIIAAYMQFIEEIYTQQVYYMQAQNKSFRDILNNESYMQAELCVLLPQQGEKKYSAKYMPENRDACIEAMFVVALSDILTRLQNMRLCEYRTGKHKTQLTHAIKRNMRRHIKDLHITVRTHNTSDSHAHDVRDICHSIFHATPPLTCRNKIKQLAEAGILRCASLPQFIHNEAQQINTRTQILANITQQIVNIAQNNVMHTVWNFNLKPSDIRDVVLQKHKHSADAYHTHRFAYSMSNMSHELSALNHKYAIIFFTSLFKDNVLTLMTQLRLHASYINVSNLMQYIVNNVFRALNIDIHDQQLLYKLSQLVEDRQDREDLLKSAQHTHRTQ